MEQTPVAKFSLRDYAFNEYSFTKPEGDDDMPLNINFKPSGKFFSKKHEYELSLAVTCSLESEDLEYIKLAFTAIFVFAEDQIEVPDFFYKNSIAIVFPYIRAFISTMTLQSNHGLVIIPTLNLTGLEKTLRDNTDIVEI